MIAMIGLIVATYAIARLIQVPMEMWHVQGGAKWYALLVTIVGGCAIAFFTLLMLSSSAPTTLP